MLNLLNKNIKQPVHAVIRDIGADDSCAEWYKSNFKFPVINLLYVKLVIIDDKPITLEILKSLLAAYCPGIDLAGEALQLKKPIRLSKQKSRHWFF